MPDPHHDPAQHPPDDSDADADADATVLPFPRRPGRSARPSTRDRRWRVERIETEPMTAQQYDLAVTTLATLITAVAQEPGKLERNPRKSRIGYTYSASLFVSDEG